MAAIGVIVAVTGGGEGELSAAIDAHPRLAVVRRCADLAEAVAAARAGVAGAVVVSDQPHLTRATVSTLVDAGIVVVGAPSSSEAGEQLTSVGVRSVAPSGARAEDVVEALSRALALHATQAPPPVRPAPVHTTVGTLVAVWGPTGSPGRTTIATNVAAELALSGRPTLLVDADVYGGAVAQAIGLTDEAAGIAGAAREAQHGSVDEAILRRYASEAAPGLWVLTGITRAARWRELAPAAVEEVLRAAVRAFEAVVVDVGFSVEVETPVGFDAPGPERNGATVAVLAMADHVIAVGSAEPLGMQRLIHGLGALRDATSAASTVVVNRVRAEVAGPRPGAAVADLLARFASVERTRVLPWDPSSCDAAAISGRVLAECAPRSRIRKAIADLAHAVLPVPSTPAPPRHPHLAAHAMGH